MFKYWINNMTFNWKSKRFDDFMIMPNHFHGIIFIVGADLCVCPGNPKQGAHTGAPLHRMVQWFKTMTTNEYLRQIHEKGWQRLDGRLWQRNYYERVIRNDRELNLIREYIRDNPLNWVLDNENPKNNLYCTP